MAMHDYHEGLPGFKEGAIFQDGCVECERRGADIEIALSQMDAPTFGRAWTRAMQLHHGQLSGLSGAEMHVLRILANIHARLEHLDLLVAGDTSYIPAPWSS